MYIENLDIKIVKEREEIKNFVRNKNDDIAKHTAKVKEIESKYQDKMERFAVVNAEINDVVIPQVFDKLERHEIPDEVVIKDGKPFLKVIDIREDALAKADEMKDMWKKHIESRQKVKETEDSIRESKKND